MLSNITHLSTTHLALLGLATLALGSHASAQDMRVAVTFENLAPTQGTFQTPVWIGIHNGAFDIYDVGSPASPALERLAEDGNIAPLAAAFLGSGAGTTEGTIPSPDGPIAPGALAQLSFLVDPTLPTSRYFSYASMVIPSNDAFISNANPMARQIFNGQGQFQPHDFFVANDRVLDAGTEVNDELPMNTAFFGQTMPDTGVPQNGSINFHAGFLPVGNGGILDFYRFGSGDFNQAGYPIARFKIRAAPAITDARSYAAIARGANEVPPVASPGVGRIAFRLLDAGARVQFILQLTNLTNVVGAHLHLAPAGQNGPIVLNLLPSEAPGGGAFVGTVMTDEFDLTGLTGPLFGMPLDALVAEMENGNIYFNVHTDDGVDPAGTGPGDFPSGEIRGQMARL